VNAIIQANGLDESALIYREQILIIPVSLVPATETPSPTPVAAQPATPVSNNQTGNRYVVQPGDTLSNIASRFNTTVGTLVQINGITNPNRIFVGQSITLPGSTTTAPATPQPTTQAQPTQAPANTPQTYVVQPGDNLYRISLRFGVSLADLASRNNITNYNFIFVGQVLAIP
jgi:LysM repeat protein